MSRITKKIYQVLKLNFGIKQTKITADTDLIQALNLSDWELELLYFKIENAFRIEIKNTFSKDEVSIKMLQNEIKESLHNFSANFK